MKVYIDKPLIGSGPRPQALKNFSITRGPLTKEHVFQYKNQESRDCVAEKVTGHFEHIIILRLSDQCHDLAKSQ